jgi:isoquinoline 1-oxidoreductase beta subunit
MGIGELASSAVATVPPAGEGNFLAYSQGVWTLTQSVPYDFGQTDQLLNEVRTYDTFNTGSVRNVYSADAAVARELVVDRLATAMGSDPYRFRRTFLRNDRGRAVLDAVARTGRWGRRMPAGTAQAIAVHAEYHGFVGALAEIDCRPHTVRRKVRDGVTGPRVTRLIIAVDVGLPVNPRGLEAQMMGGAMDGIGQILTESLHLRDGHFAEGSWDNYFYSRQWNTPLDLRVIVMPPTTDTPGGAGEFGVAVTKAAVANAYIRATGHQPDVFPVNHDGPLGFQPLPTVPPIPQSPRDGLHHEG